MVLAFQMDRTRKDESEGLFVCLFVLPAPQRKGLIIPHTCSNGKARHLSQKVLTDWECGRKHGLDSLSSGPQEDRCHVSIYYSDRKYRMKAGRRVPEKKIANWSPLGNNVVEK